MNENSNQFVPHVSVVIPAYNAESYLKRCLDSVLNQEFVEYEIIVVNDGSTDSTAKIIDEYSQIYKQIIPVHQENKGVSAARNVGIEKSRGDWLVFVDCDDWIEPNMLHDLYSAVQMYTADLVMGKMYHCNGTNGQVKQHDLKEPLIECSQNPNCENSDEKAIVGYALRRGVAYSNLAKMYRKTIVLENHIQFDSDFCYCEDVMFNCKFMMHAKKIRVLDSHCYTADSTPGSLTKKYSKSLVKATILSHKMLWELFKEKNIQEDMWYELLDIQFLNGLWDVVFCLLSGKYSNISRKQAVKESINILKKSEFVEFMKKYHTRQEVCTGSQTAMFAKRIYRVGYEKICICLLNNYILCRDFVRKLMGGK